MMTPAGGAMRRRDFIITALGSAAWWPLAAQVAWGQRQADPPIIGLLWLGSGDQILNQSFRDGLRDNGLIDGVNVRVLVRFADNNPDRLADLAHELAQAGSRLIVTSGTTAVRAAHTSLPAMPVVMAGSADPVEVGFAQSLARPGGRITGISIMGGLLLGKQIELLKELLPSAKAFAAFLHAANPGNEVFRRGLASAGRSLNVEMHFRDIHSPDGLADAFEWASQVSADAVFVIADPVFHAHRSTIGQLAESKRLPWVGNLLQYAHAGAVAAYAFNMMRLARDSARYAALILRGADPAEIPIEQPTRFYLVVNLKAAKALGISIPPSLLASADEVIE